MAKLLAISENFEQVSTHIVFVHGLSGHIKKTWTSITPKSSVLWPTWLEEDIPEVGIWLLGYPSKISRWFGHDMSLFDRARNLQALLLADPRLRTGNIVFVTHSLGGILIQHVLRNAQTESGNNIKSEQFLSRIKKLVFLGVPQSGHILANISVRFRLVLRPSKVINDLELFSERLRDLNFWYRHFSNDNKIENLVLAESRTVSPFGPIVPNMFGVIAPPWTADYGLIGAPITVDENHISICKPVDRDSEVYVHILNFLKSPTRPPSLTTKIDSADNHAEILDEVNSTLKKVAHGIDISLIDAAVTKKLNRLRESRFFVVFDTIAYTKELAKALIDGEFIFASSQIKREALLWCARFLAGSNAGEAEDVLKKLSSQNDELYCIAKSIILAFQGNLSDSLENLSSLGTPAGYGAAYICILKNSGYTEANEWLQKVSLSTDELDSDAKFFYIIGSIEEGKWDTAFSCSKTLSEADFKRTPALYLAAADAYLLQAIPDGLRVNLLHLQPVGIAMFSLKGDPTSLAYRRTAVRLYEQLQLIAESLELSEIVNYASDKTIWLQLMDPETRESAQEMLIESINDSSTFLRRLGLALQFNVEVDLERAEKEVDRQTALTGGKSREAAIGRLILATNKDDPADAAKYVNSHKSQLLEHIHSKVLYSIEIEMLVRSGQLERAEECMQEIIKQGLNDYETARLQIVLSEATGSDPIADRLAAFRESDSIIDLRNLVIALEESQDWPMVCEYGRILLDRTDAIEDAHRYVFALYTYGRLDVVLEVFRSYPSLFAHHSDLPLLLAQTYFELGDLKKSQETLIDIRGKSDNSRARQLHIHLAIASGDWESLQGFVEEEWNLRSMRDAEEMLRAGQIAQQIGAARAKEFVYEAAKLAPTNPEVLFGCYITASKGGWESTPEVHEWLRQAESFSGDDGPVQRIPIEKIIERQPGWERLESETFTKLSKGEIPIFSAGYLLNRSMLSLYLMPAVINKNEQDVRKRQLVFSFSGSRERRELEIGTIAMDTTALITAEFVGIFEEYLKIFDRILVPHNALAWLMEEKAKILYHQPSLIDAANDLVKLISSGVLRTFEGTVSPPESLTSEIGETLASLITEASQGCHSEQVQRLVVHGGPIYKVNADNSMEEIDSSKFEPFLCRGVDIVRMLVQRSILTTTDATEACAALSIWERSSYEGASVQIQENAVLYLNDSAVSHFQSLELLSKIHQAGITVIVSQSKVDNAKALLAYRDKGADVISIVEQLRNHIRDGLTSEKVQLGKAPRIDESNGTQASVSHPTTTILQLIEDADVAVVDDRFINKYQSISSGESAKPLISTLDLLKFLTVQEKISIDRNFDLLAKLRLANFSLVPITTEELTACIANCSISNGVLKETAELRAIRENMLSVRMNNVLHSDKDFEWLDGITKAFMETIRQQWKDGMDVDSSSAKSNWLVSLCDVRSWAHAWKEESDQLVYRYRNWLTLLLLLPANFSKQNKDAYWFWLESTVLRKVREEDPDTYMYLSEWGKNFIEEGVQNYEKRSGDDNE